MTWQPGCWHTLWPPSVVESFYREKARRARRPPVALDRFACPALRDASFEEPPAEPRSDALAEVVAGIVERMLPALVPRLVELLMPALEKRLSVTVTRITAELLKDRP